MTLKELKAVLDSTGLQTVYLKFEENAAPDPPYIVFYEGPRETFYADDGPYFTRVTVEVELYTDAKAPDLEEAVESALDAAGLNYQKDQDYINEESLLLIAYELEIIED